MRTSCSLALTSFAIAFFAATQVLGFQDPFNETKAEILSAERKRAQQRAASNGVGSSSASKASPRTLVAQNNQAQMPDADTDGKIVVNFSGEDWSEVIPWFAEQANLSLQPVADYPDGTFTHADDSYHTVLEGLDLINHALRIRPEPYTLIRNRNLLVLWKVRDANFPNDLIETVNVEDLDNRGKHETISCIFDVGELDAAEIGKQVEQLVSRDNKEFYAIFETANQIHVRETGGQLRKIRDLIQTSLKKEFGDEMKLKVYNLKNLDVDSFMGLARGLLGMEEGSNKRKDEKLLISVQPFAERLFIRGNEKWLAEFDNVAKTIDSGSDEVVDGVVLDDPTLQMYPIFVDPKLAFDTLQTMLEAREDVRMQQDENTGSITVLGRKDDHQLVSDTLAAISGDGSGGFALIQLLKGDPEGIIFTLQNLFRQSSSEASSGPVLLANTVTRQIIVRGTPQEVDMVKKMVSELDANSVVENSGPRSRRRIIPMGERAMEELAPLLPDLLMSAGRKNHFNMIMPKQRRDVQGSIKQQQQSSGESVDDFLRGLGGPSKNPDQSRRRVPARRLKTSNLNSSEPNTALNTHPSTTPSTTLSEILAVVAHVAGVNPPVVSGLITIQEPQEQQLGNQGHSAYQPPPEIQSVPGAPIVGRFSNGSLILDSEDLDALDDLVYEIENRMEGSSEVQRPTFFFLEHRQAGQMMSFLNNYYSLSGGGGGAADASGGGGGLVEGMVSNMLGGSSGGDLLGDLFGGGGGGSVSGGFLEGDVRFGVDIAFNSLWVAGATETDLDEISILIDTLDQPEAPHDPQLLGGFRTIDIIHRDPMEVKEIIEPLLGDWVESSQPAPGGGGGGGDAARVSAMVQQLAGGGKKGGGGAAAMVERKPQVRLGVDMATRQLLVSGPEFIYKKIVNMVSELDRPELSKPPVIHSMPVNNQEALVNALKEMFGPLIVVVGEEDTAAGGSAQNSRSNSGNRAGGQGGSDSSAGASALDAADIRSRVQAAQRANGRGGGGGGNRGGGNRGGGGRGR